jgi:hypothetical protein
MATTAQKAPSALTEHLAIVNELLPGSTSAGAYALGTITGMALMSGKFPPRVVLEMAARAPDMDKAMKLANGLSNVIRGFQERPGGR